MSGTGSAWGGGYVTDSAYPDGYFPQMSPHHLALVALLAGVLPPDTGPGLSYMELGCGTGFGALLLAASNPGWTVIGIDFSAASIATGRAMAASCGIANARFIEADLTTLAGSAAAEALPEADIITLHGVWSWVTPPVQAGIVRLLAEKLRPGGLAQVSFNSLPAWSGAVGMRQAAIEFGRERASGSAAQASAGLGFVERLADAGARYLAGEARVAGVLAHGRVASSTYLAHEFANEGWRPCFFSEVAAALAGAKLDFVSSCHLFETQPAMMLTPAQRALLGEVQHPWTRETVKDMCLDRALRQDLFVRGAVPSTGAERAARLASIRLALLRAPDVFDRELALPVGTAELSERSYRPIVEALATGPCRVSDLLVAAGEEAPDVAELLIMLVGSHQVMPVAEADGVPNHGAARLNAFASRRRINSERLNGPMGLASGRLGNPVPCQMLDLVVHGALASGGIVSAAEAAAGIGRGRDAAEIERLAIAMEASIAAKAPAWRTLGLIGEVV